MGTRVLLTNFLYVLVSKTELSGGNMKAWIDCWALEILLLVVLVVIISCLSIPNYIEVKSVEASALPAPTTENAECTKFYNNALRLTLEGDAVPSNFSRGTSDIDNFLNLRQAKYLGATAYSSLYQNCKLKWNGTNAR